MIDHSMIEIRRLKTAVGFIQTILRLVCLSLTFDTYRAINLCLSYLIVFDSVRVFFRC